MPQRREKRKAIQDLCELKRKFERLERSLIQQSDSSSTSSSESSTEESEDSRAMQDDPQQQPVLAASANTPVQEPLVNDLQFLGEGPKASLQTGPELHEELVSRWPNYLTVGLSSEVRKDLILKFPIPSNCLTLQPPKLNEEVRSVIATQTQKNDRYMLHLQEQMGASLSAIGSILNLKLLDPNVPLTLDDTKLQILAEAAQLLANSFHAVSVKRRFDIQPFLSQESRDASYKCPIDEFLFGSGFLEQLKACQNVRKVAEEIKKPKPSFSQPSTSLGPRDLNSKRPFYKTKKKRSPSPTFERRLKMFHRKDHQRNRENQDHRQAQKFRKWRTKK
nr:unnamed protein product [Callosobruchus analis]